jgi:hypothetical protein
MLDLGRLLTGSTRCGAWAIRQVTTASCSSNAFLGIAAAFPEKGTLPALVRECPLSSRYCKTLQTYLTDKSVVGIDGIRSDLALTADSFASSEWLRFKADLIGLDFRQADFHPICSKGEKTTAAVIVQSQEHWRKALYCVQGTNRLPGTNGLMKIAGLLRKASVKLKD